ncbi:hypothetical protein MWU50_15060 [Flavobacteriaceae bacterium S0862]|nr:hypothetical protein [Flavobacteriaceae bacterium S0862]
MIKFFRKIRYDLMEKNKTVKYLKYAIGEIILVMVGILLALQVNNWNEERKIKLKETKLLIELRSDLVQNVDDITGNLIYLNITKTANETIIYHLENNLEYNDSLDYHFGNLYPYITFNPNQTTYESLKQIGLDIISNDSLRISLSDLYANRFVSYKKFEDIYMLEHYENYMKPMMMSELTDHTVYTSAKPKNYEQFVEKEQNKDAMVQMADICDSYILMQSQLREEAEQLIIQIDKEINDKIL